MPRGPSPHGTRPNPERAYAKSAIAIADRFFKFDYRHVYFSGFVTSDDTGNPLTVEVWNKNALVYKVDFEDEPVEGVLFVQFKNQTDTEEAFGQDVLGAVKKTINQVRNLRADCPRITSATVDEDMLSLEICMKP